MSVEGGVPRLEDRLPELMAFVTGLAQDVESGQIRSWEVMAERTRAFFTAERLAEVDALAPGWRAMCSYGDGVTLVHVMCAFAGLLASPEFRAAPAAQQALMQWIVLCHDTAKEVRQGKRDLTHSFRSAAATAALLPRAGFPVSAEYEELFEHWFNLTNAACTLPPGATDPVQDNARLPAILAGIERLFGRETAASLIVKTVLVHQSITVVAEWPQAAALSEPEAREYVDAALWPLLRMMMLADNDGWSLFEPETRAGYREETLAVFDRLCKVSPSPES